MKIIRIIHRILKLSYNQFLKWKQETKLVEEQIQEDSKSSVRDRPRQSPESKPLVRARRLRQSPDSKASVIARRLRQSPESKPPVRARMLRQSPESKSPVRKTNSISRRRERKRMSRWIPRLRITEKEATSPKLWIMRNKKAWTNSYATRLDKSRRKGLSQIKVLNRSQKQMLTELVLRNFLMIHALQSTLRRNLIIHLLQSTLRRNLMIHPLQPTLRRNLIIHPLQSTLRRNLMIHPFQPTLRRNKHQAQASQWQTQQQVQLRELMIVLRQVLIIHKLPSSLHRNK